MKETIKRIIVDYYEFISSLYIHQWNINIEKKANYVFVGPRRAVAVIFDIVRLLGLAMYSFFL